MASDKDIKFHTTPESPPVCQLQVKDAVAKLTDKEKLYAHWMSQASWMGSKVVLNQVSTESPVLFDLFMLLFTSSSVEQVQDSVVPKGGEAKKMKTTAVKVNEKDFQHFLEYVATFFNNMGNYVSFGDSKFIPRVSKEKFEYIVLEGCSQGQRAEASKLLSQCLDAVYSLTATEKSLGFPGSGTSSYFGPGVTKEDVELAGRFLTREAISPYNTRVFKLGPNHLEIRLACCTYKKGSEKEIEGVKVTVSFGDYDQLLAPCVDALKEARKHVANDTQGAMLDSYVKHFSEGDLDDHKESQKHWINDKGPVVETNIGFIESYRDPAGVRGEFEGFVSVVNKEMSAKFGVLVARAHEFLPKLPWPKEFEKDEFKKPDFTSLEVVSFAGSGIPAGINIPNYDDIRQNVGFKNVSLGNVISAQAPSEKFDYLADVDQDLYAKLRVPSFEVQVGNHELLGHGSGKLFVEGDDGKLNFENVVSPLSGIKVNKWYKRGETYDSVFSTFGSSYEECRAECVGIYLSTDRDLLQVFGHKSKQEQDDIMYINWLNMVRAGVCALEFYSPEQTKWRQAHMQARYGILQVLLRAGKGFVNLEIEEDNATITLDRTKIYEVGMPAIREFLLKIQVYKATADAEEAGKMYSDVTGVDDKFLALRNIVLNRKKPRRLFVQIHSSIQDGKVAFKEFDASCQGVIESFVARFG